MGKIKSQALICATVVVFTRIAWSSNSSFLTISLLLPILWALCEDRHSALALAFFYYLSASMNMINPINSFFDSTLKGHFLWVVSSLILSLPFFLFYTKKQQPLMAILVIGVLVLPPLGIIGWANPITCAGILFPGTGNFGIILTLILIYFLSFFALSKPKSTIIFVLILPIFFKVNDVNTPKWIQINTSDHYYQNNFCEDYNRIVSLKDRIRNEKRVIILPEGSLGLWTETTKKLWLKEDKTIVGGAKIPCKNSFDNALVKLQDGSHEIVYRQQIPPPISMYNPLKKWAYNSYFFDPKTFKINGKKVAPIICFESFIVWPLISKLSKEIDVLLCVSNHRELKSDFFIKKQEQLLNIWCNLYRTKLVTSYNI